MSCAVKSTLASRRKEIEMIKKITTDVPIIKSVDEGTEPSVYIECNGEFYRARAAEARKAIGLGGIVCVDGLLCVETEKENE